MKSNTTSKNPANSSLTNNNHFITHLRDTLLRGGRLTKYKGQLASFAPSLSTAICTPTLELGQQIGNAIGAQTRKLATGALTAAMLVVAPTALISTGAQAGSCTMSNSNKSIWTCSKGKAGPADVNQAIAAAAAGALTVTTDAGFGIAAAVGNAIQLKNGPFNTSMTFIDKNKSTISGGSIGIAAFNDGTGATSITATGAVTGTEGYGIYVKNNATATDLTINAAIVTGGAAGIVAHNNGTGATSITATGAVNATTNGHGISVNNNATATDITINAAAVTGGTAGIDARNDGTGATSITATGAVNATNGHGISVNNSATATDITINAAAVTGGTAGIDARNDGTGATSITATGAVNATNGHGISVNNSATATDITINAAAVSSAGQSGIFAHNTGTGATSITVNGVVTGGGQGAGIFNNTVNASTITLNSGAAVSATSGDAIIDTNGATSLILNTGSSVTGNILLGGGNDAINLAGGDFSGVTVFNGEGGVNDSLIFSGSDGVFDQSLMTNVEEVTIDNGSGMGLSFEGDAFDASGLTGSLLTVQNGGILNATNGFALTGNLVNSSGIVSMKNGAIDAPATISGDYTGGGELQLDVDFTADTADTLEIAGNVVGGGTAVGVNDISSGAATGNDITLVKVAGTTADGDFTLASNVVNGAFDYNTLELVGGEWVLKSVAAGGDSGPAPAPAPAFTPFAGSFETIPQAFLALEALPSFANRIRGRIKGASSGDETGIESATWARVTGGKRNIDSASSTTGADFDTNYSRVQIGGDFTLKEDSSGLFIAGINASYGQADTDVNSTTGSGNIDTSGYSLGLSATWLMADDTYVDLQAQKSWYSTDLSAGGVGAGTVNDIDGDGHSVSVEVGRSIALNDELTITPQAQLSYAKVDTDDFIGANAEVVKLTNSKSLKARFGAELSKQLDSGTRGFILASVIHEFEDETQVNVSGANLTNSVDQWSGELGGGIKHAWGEGTTHYETFAAITAGTSLNNFGDSNSVQLELGLKAKF